MKENTMELFEAINKRRSVRKFLDKEIPENIIQAMLNAARLSPSGGNGQNWIFGVISDKRQKEKLAEAAGNQTWIKDAPIIIAGCSDIGWDIAEQPEDDFGKIVNYLRFSKEFIGYLCKYPDRKACMTLFSNPTPLIPMEHMFLTAVSHGLSACFIGFLDVEKANKILNLPENITCLFLLPVGYPDETPKEKETKSIEEISFRNIWD
jgi:nitroreductase